MNGVVRTAHGKSPTISEISRHDSLPSCPPDRRQPPFCRVSKRERVHLGGTDPSRSRRRTPVEDHQQYFLRHALYDYGMFWYELFPAISAAVLGYESSPGKRLQAPCAVETLLLELVLISRYSTFHGGDITKRNHEALGNLLWRPMTSLLWTSSGARSEALVKTGSCSSSTTRSTVLMRFDKRNNPPAPTVNRQRRTNENGEYSQCLSGDA
jgi:hypothetical protein